MEDIIDISDRLLSTKKNTDIRQILVYAGADDELIEFVHDQCRRITKDIQRVRDYSFQIEFGSDVTESDQRAIMAQVDAAMSKIQENFVALTESFVSKLLLSEMKLFLCDKLRSPK